MITTFNQNAAMVFLSKNVIYCLSPLYQMQRLKEAYINLIKKILKSNKFFNIFPTLF